MNKLKNGATKQIFLGFKDILTMSESYFTNFNKCNASFKFDTEKAKSALNHIRFSRVPF